MWDLAECAHALGMKVHVDGARFANAVAALGCAPADLAWRAGVDVLSFGGTKNGMQFGEAVVFFDAALAEEFGRKRMQGGQLASKMRFLAAPWVGVLEDGAWLRHAAHANAMAARLAAAGQRASRSATAGSCRGQRRVRRAAAIGHRCRAREGLAVLQLRRCNGSALHVLVGHHHCEHRRHRCRPARSGEL
jgi:hypothetical protein